MARSKPAQCAVETVAEVTVVRILDRRILGEEAVEAIAATLRRLIDQGRIRLLVDCTGVEYMSTALLSALLKAHRLVEAAGGRLAVCALGPMPAESLAITRLDLVLAVYPDREQALEAF